MITTIDGVSWRDWQWEKLKVIEVIYNVPNISWNPFADATNVGNRLFLDFYVKALWKNRNSLSPVCGKVLYKVWKSRRFTITHLWQKLRESNVFTTENTEEMIWRNFCISWLWILYSQCGNYGNLLSHFFDKNFVKATFLLKKILKSWLDDFFGVTVNFLLFHTVCV